jgi:hypothetical protein
MQTRSKNGEKRGKNLSSRDPNLSSRLSVSNTETLGQIISKYADPDPKNISCPFRKFIADVGEGLNWFSAFAVMKIKNTLEAVDEPSRLIFLEKIKSEVPVQSAANVIKSSKDKKEIQNPSHPFGSFVSMADPPVFTVWIPKDFSVDGRLNEVYVSLSNFTKILGIPQVRLLTTNNDVFYPAVVVNRLDQFLVGFAEVLKGKVEDLNSIKVSPDLDYASLSNEGWHEAGKQLCKLIFTQVLFNKLNINAKWCCLNGSEVDSKGVRNAKPDTIQKEMVIKVLSFLLASRETRVINSLLSHLVSSLLVEPLLEKEGKGNNQKNVLKGGTPLNPAKFLRSAEDYFNIYCRRFENKTDNKGRTIVTTTPISPTVPSNLPGLVPVEKGAIKELYDLPFKELKDRIKEIDNWGKTTRNGSTTINFDHAWNLSARQSVEKELIHLRELCWMAKNAVGAMINRRLVSYYIYKRMDKDDKRSRVIAINAIKAATAIQDIVGISAEMSAYDPNNYIIPKPILDLMFKKWSMLDPPITEDGGLVTYQILKNNHQDFVSLRKYADSFDLEHSSMVVREKARSAL